MRQRKQYIWERLEAIIIMVGFIMIGVLIGIMNTANPDFAGFILSVLFIFAPSLTLGVILQDLNSQETE